MTPSAMMNTIFMRWVPMETEALWLVVRTVIEREVTSWTAGVQSQLGGLGKLIIPYANWAQ